MIIASPSIGLNGCMLMFAKNCKTSHNIHYAKIILSKIMFIKEDFEKVPVVEADTLLARANEARRFISMEWKRVGRKTYKGFADMEDFQQLIDYMKEFEAVLDFLSEVGVINEDDAEMVYNQAVYTALENFSDEIIESHDAWKKEVEKND